MLAEAKRAEHSGKGIVFLGWEPHPMNTTIKMTYLTGGDEVFGPNFGGATVYTNIRKGYSTDCPNVGKLLANLEFTLPMESEVMGKILDDGEDPDKAAEEWLKANPAVLDTWLAGVTTRDGGDGLAAVRDVARRLTASGARRMEWLTGTKIPVGQWAGDGVDWLTANAAWFFDGLAVAVNSLIAAILWVLQTPPPLAIVAVFAAIAWFLQRSWWTVALVVLGFLFILNQGYWEETTETLTLVLSAVVVCMGLGVPIGIAAAHRPRFYAALRPVLDLMQTLPTFVYLIPAIVFFGIGMVPGLIATAIFVIPAPIRLTHLGIVTTPKELKEAGIAFGATPGPALAQGRAALGAAADHGRPDPDHHAVAVDGGDRRAGRRRRAGRAGGARAQHRQHRARLRGGAGHRRGRDRPRPHVPEGLSR